jgi:hypothetical protein
MPDLMTWHQRACCVNAVYVICPYAGGWGDCLTGGSILSWGQGKGLLGLR